MAVETPHMNLLASQLLTTREMLKLNHLYTNAQINGSVPLSSPPLHQSTVSDPNSIKQTRDSIAESNALWQPLFLDQNLVHHFHTQQSEIDRFIAQQTEKMRMELEEQKMRNSRMLLLKIQQEALRKLKEKDEEIEKMEMENWVLQEKVKNLCAENQMWKDSAKASEAAADSLRSDLERLLAYISEERCRGAAAAGNDVAESSCASSNRPRREEENDAVCGAATVGNLCRECGARESVVLLLPCRHLCLCTTCGSTIRICPLCHSAINASVHVNLS